MIPPTYRWGVGARSVGYAPVRASRKTASLAAKARPWILYLVHDLYNTGGSAQGNEVLRSQILRDLTVRNDLVRDRRPSQPASPQLIGAKLVSRTRFYKSNIMLFRWVGCLLINEQRGTRPSPEYRVPVLRQLAEALHQQFEVMTPAEELGAEFRSPLRILVQAAYRDDVDDESGLVRTRRKTRVRECEMVMMFVMFAEALGIPCAYAMLSYPTGNRVMALCKIQAGDEADMDRAPEQSVVYDPQQPVARALLGPFNNGQGLQQLGYQQAQTYLIDDDFLATIGPSLMLERGQLPPEPLADVEVGVLPEALQNVRDNGLLAAPEWSPDRVSRAYDEGNVSWRGRGLPYPLVDRGWANALLEAFRTFDPMTMHEPFLVNLDMHRGRTLVAENLGPSVTSGIIAGMARVYSMNYAGLLTRFVQWVWTSAQDTEWFNQVDGAARRYYLGKTSDGRPRRMADVCEVVFDLDNDGPLHLSAVFGEWVRRELPYCEETVGVEEITGPLVILFWLLNRRRDVMFDCDDVSCFFMCNMESVVVSATAKYQTLVRALAAGRSLDGDLDRLRRSWSRVLDRQGVEPPVVMTAVRLAGNPPVQDQFGQLVYGDKFHVYPLVYAGDGWSCFDVSNPLDLPLPDELVHKGNEETRAPQIVQSWLGLFYGDAPIAALPRQVEALPHALATGRRPILERLH